jgi:hypothetical protein
LKQSQIKSWQRLDNAAKIFPPTSSLKDTKVFRFACELYESVEPISLQAALDSTMEHFPFYRSVLKKGVFWYYFEQSSLKPKVTKESLSPCAPIYSGEGRELLFRVTYFQRRISLEVYHALSDGTGAVTFLKTLVYYYLLIQYPDSFYSSKPTLDFDTSPFQKKDDSFLKYYLKEKRPKYPLRLKPAHHFHGERFPKGELGILEGCMSVKKLLEISRSFGATITEFLIALLICSIHEGMTARESLRPVTVTVPVNLRKYFPSASMRNFFATIETTYPFHTRDGSFEDVLLKVKEDFSLQLNQETLKSRMNQFSAIEHSIPTKLVPLVLKKPCLQAANWMTERNITAAFSNIGRIDMPKEMERFIRLFDFFSATKRLQGCSCSFKDRFMVSFTSPYLNTDVQRYFFKHLSQLGLEIELQTNLTEEET